MAIFNWPWSRTKSLPIEASSLQAPAVRSPPPRQSLSALLCTYNHAQFLEGAIERVLGQTRRPDEMLILDDASTDDTSAILDRFASRFDWIKIVRKTVNAGYNAGITDLTSRARGAFIHCGAADDEMHPDFFALTMEQADYHPQAGIVSGELVVRDEHDKWNLTLEVPGWLSGYYDGRTYLHDYLEKCDATGTLAPSTLYRRAVVAEVGGWRSDLKLWDVSFVLQAAALKHGMCYVDKPVYTWVHRAKGLTQALAGNFESSKEMYLRYYDLMTSDEFRRLFGKTFPGQWLRANLRYAVDQLVDGLQARLAEEAKSVDADVIAKVER